MSKLWLREVLVVRLCARLWLLLCAAACRALSACEAQEGQTQATAKVGPGTPNPAL